jgi:hypothetical protein
MPELSNRSTHRFEICVSYIQDSSSLYADITPRFPLRETSIISRNHLLRLFSKDRQVCAESPAFPVDYVTDKLSQPERAINS